MSINVIQCVYHGKIVSQTLYIMVKKIDYIFWSMRNYKKNIYIYSFNKILHVSVSHYWFNENF